MKEQLEIKHLKGYLGYGLKGMVEGFKTPVELTGLLQNDIHICCPIDGFDYVDYDMFKPILRGKSHLRTLENEILIRWGGGLSDKAKTNWLKQVIDEMMYSAFNSLRYDFGEFMLENHIDVFGLIDKNLAVDINKL